MIKYLLILLPLFGLSQDTVKVSNNYFDVIYSQKYKQPLKVTYSVLCNQKDSTKYSRVGLTFKGYKGVITSTDADYINNNFDKGHLAPAEDFDCDSLGIISTFTYLNCALQHYLLNRGVWKSLEEFERKLSINNTIRVEVIIEFKTNKRLKSGTLIPSGFTKTIYMNGKVFHSYYFPNIAPKYKAFTHYQIT